jgi:hypothetical protein
MKLILSTLLAAAALPTLADVSSSASLTGLRYELVDLAPNDGIAPSIRFTGMSQAESIAFWDFCNLPWCQRSQGSFTTPASTSLQQNESGPLSVTASVSQAGLLTSGQWANGSSIGSGAGRYLAQARYQGVLGQPLFVVSAHTGVRITGQYTLDARVDPTEIIGPTHSDYGARAAVFFRSNFLDGPAPLVEIEAFHREQPMFVHETGELSVLLRNDKDHQATLWGKWGVWSSGQVPIGIPEPSTYALMFAGLAMIGARVRQRRT